ncbi:hypothetical protein GOBAR_DD10073 [Gossypium barbadense]|nr:hypothetical protein GOBAR_DD10073 [Gossypium barbadense]
MQFSIQFAEKDRGSALAESSIPDSHGDSGCRMSSITSDDDSNTSISCKKTGKGKRPGKGGNRFWKSIGLGFKTPREAIEGSTKPPPLNNNCSRSPIWPTVKGW